MRRMEYSGFIQHFSNDDVNYERPHYPLSPQLGYYTVSSQNTAPFAFNYDYSYFGVTLERTRRSVNDRLKKFLDDAEAERVSGREKIRSSSGVKRRRVEGDQSMPKRLIRRDDDVSYLTSCIDLSLDRASEMLASAEIAVSRRQLIGNCRRIKHYSSGHRILVVGDGDFSFSTSLAKAFGCASNMIATSHDSQRFLLLNYASALPNLMELKARKCKVMHDNDATKMASHSILGKMKFDRIVFNFPFAGFFDDLPRDSQLIRHKGLVSKFMQNAVEMMGENGEIHIRNKTTDYFEEWNIEVFGWLHRLRLVETVDFDRLDYPGYDTKYGFGGDGNFNCYPSKTYKFAHY